MDSELIIKCSSCEKMHRDFFFELEERGFMFRCNGCKHESHVHWSNGIKKSVKNEDAEVCPKCKTEDTVDSDYCVSCGLKKERWQHWIHETPLADTHLESLWLEVLRCWEVEEKHQALAQIARTKQALPWLAAKYRSYSDEHPSDKECQIKMNRISKQAQFFLLQEKSTSSNKAKNENRKLRWFLFMLVLLVGSIGLLTLGKRLNRADMESEIHLQ